MPHVFIKQGGEPTETWVRFYYPTGSDIGAVCAARGWKPEQPSGVRVLAQDGSVIEGGPAPALEPMLEIKPDKPHKEK